MKKKDVAKTSAGLLFIVGLFFVISSKATVTGAVIDVQESYAEIRTVVGFLLLVVSAAAYVSIK